MANINPAISEHQDEKTLITKLKGTRMDMHKAISWILNHSSWRNAVVFQIRKLQMDQDLTNEVFHECLTTLTLNIRKGNFRNESKLKTYFEGICANILKDRLSKKMTQKKYFTYTEPEVMAQQEKLDTTIEREHKRQTAIRSTLNSMINKLNEKCRKILGYIVLDYSMKEIAKLLNMETQSIKNRALKCRKELREIGLSNPELLKEIKSLI